MQHIYSSAHIGRHTPDPFSHHENLEGFCVSMLPSLIVCFVLLDYVQHKLVSSACTLVHNSLNCLILLIFTQVLHFSALLIS